MEEQQRQVAKEVQRVKEDLSQKLLVLRKSNEKLMKQKETTEQDVLKLQQLHSETLKQARHQAQLHTDKLRGETKQAQARAEDEKGRADHENARALSLEQRLTELDKERKQLVENEQQMQQQQHEREFYIQSLKSKHASMLSDTNTHKAALTKLQADLQGVHVSETARLKKDHLEKMKNLKRSQKTEKSRHEEAMQRQVKLHKKNREDLHHQLDDMLAQITNLNAALSKANNENVHQRDVYDERIHHMEQKYKAEADSEKTAPPDPILNRWSSAQ